MAYIDRGVLVALPIVIPDSRVDKAVRSMDTTKSHSCSTPPTASQSRRQVPAKCAEKLMASTRQPRVLVGVCKRALSMAPADCYNLLPRNMPENASTRLCVRAETTGPAACTRFRGLFGQYGLDVTTRLCEGAPGQGPAECFYRTAFFTKFSVDDRIKLCNGASTDAPARCNTPPWFHPFRCDRFIDAVAFDSIYNQ